MNFHYGKANRRLRWIIGAVMGCLVGLGIAAFWQMRIAQERLEVSTSQALASDARRQVSTELHEALHTALQAFDRRPSIEAQTALLECLNRAQRIRRIVPCADGEKAVGVVFSHSTPPLLAVASLAFGDGATRTIIRVMDMDGSLLRTVTVPGDARALAFSGGMTLTMVHDGTVTTLDLASGVVEDSRVPTGAAPVGGAGNADSSGPLPCEQEHPKGLRYLTTALTADRRFHAYTTEGNEIIVHDRTTGVCDEPLRAHTHNILALAWSDDGRYLASAGAIADGDGRHGFIVWDRQQIHPAATRIQELQQSGAGVTAISANGGSWIVGGIGRSLLWDHTVSPLPAGLGGVRLAALRDDGGEAAVADWDGNWMRLRRTRNGIDVLDQGKSPKSLLGLLYHGAQLIIVDADGRILGGGSTLTASNLRTGRREIACVGTAASDGPMALVERDAKGRLFVGVVDLERAIESPFPIPMSDCGALAHAPRQRLAMLASANYEPALLVPLDGKGSPTAILNPLRSESGLPTILSYLALSYDARRAFGLSNGRDIAIFDIPTRRFVGALAIGEAAGIAVSRDGSRAISASGGKVALWTLQPEDWRIWGGRLLDGWRSPGK